MKLCKVIHTSGKWMKPDIVEKGLELGHYAEWQVAAPLRGDTCLPPSALTDWMLLLTLTGVANFTISAAIVQLGSIFSPITVLLCLFSTVELNPCCAICFQNVVCCRCYTMPLENGSIRGLWCSKGGGGEQPCGSGHGCWSSGSHWGVRRVPVVVCDLGLFCNLVILDICRVLG